MRTFSSLFMGTMFFALIISILMFLFWPPLPTEEVVVLAFDGECPAPEVVTVPVPFPVFLKAPDWDARSLECFFFEPLDDWMCPVPAGGPWQ